MRGCRGGGWGALALVSLAVVGAACGGGTRKAPVSVGTEAVEATPGAAGHEPQEEPPQEGVLHLVQPGQTLWRIARAYGTTVEILAEVNGLQDPTRLEAGQVLFIPGAQEVLEISPFPAPPPEPPELRQQDPPLAGLAWPVPGGRMLSGYGAPRGGRPHRGLDIGAAPGTAVIAAADGRVRYAGETLRGYGKTVIVDHEGGWATLYAHNAVLLVARGEPVRRGQTIARVGRTGKATGPHCHFELRRHGRPLDPLPYFGDAVAGRLP